jgi:putative DNA primase/helicase
VSLGRGLTHCPAHDDRHPSLSVQPGRVAVLWKCHAGCDRSDVAQAIRNLGL